MASTKRPPSCTSWCFSPLDTRASSQIIQFTAGPKKISELLCKIPFPGKFLLQVPTQRSRPRLLRREMVFSDELRTAFGICGGESWKVCRTYFALIESPRPIYLCCRPSLEEQGQIIQRINFCGCGRICFQVSALPNHPAPPGSGRAPRALQQLLWLPGDANSRSGSARSRISPAVFALTHNELSQLAKFDIQIDGCDVNVVEVRAVSYTIISKDPFESAGKSSH